MRTDSRTDAFYFVARLNRRDQHHQRVVEFSRNFRARLLTSDWVLMEVADALAASECRRRVREFILRLQPRGAQAHVNFNLADKSTG